VRVATWNVNGLKARLGFVIHWLRAREPDIVGLQEIKTTDDQFPHEAIAALGYGAVTHGQKAWNGVAVLSRRRVEVIQQGLPGQEALGARLLAVEVDDLMFVTVYCPNGKHTGHEDFRHKLAWLDSLAAWVEREIGTSRAARAAIVCGDFNVCPGALDSWNEAELAGQIFHTEAERSRVRRLFAGGLHDVFRERYPDRRAFSWWDYRAGAFHRQQGLRIDLLLATRTVVERTTSVEIDRDYRKKKDALTPSDHAPVIADLG
jgi:exodeoxyribonuclease-3